MILIHSSQLLHALYNVRLNALYVVRNVSKEVAIC